MKEIWLQSNRRALSLGMILPSTWMGVGLLMLFWPRGQQPTALWIWLVGLLLIVSGGLLVAGLLMNLSRPRIAYDEGNILFYLQGNVPIAIPLETVEAFFLGQGPALLRGENESKSRTVNLVARLSQRETDWANRKVNRSLGVWADGYVRIRGTWCEPLNLGVVKRLNKRLRQLHNEAKEKQPADAE